MRAVLLTTMGLLAATAPAAAQFGEVTAAPDTWLSGWVGGYLGTDRIDDGSDGGFWDFGSAFAGGLGIHRKVGSSLLLGIDASIAPAPFERYERVSDNERGELLDDGTAKLATALATARLRYGGGAGFSMYLTGGAGTLVYGMPELGWDPDLALMTGAGLEYMVNPRQSLFLEWDRYWAFHQSEGVDENTSNHSKLRIGARLGF